jgi:hypothetical protein
VFPSFCGFRVRQSFRSLPIRIRLQAPAYRNLTSLELLSNPIQVRERPVAAILHSSAFSLVASEESEFSANESAKSLSLPRPPDRFFLISYNANGVS